MHAALRPAPRPVAGVGAGAVAQPVSGEYALPLIPLDAGSGVPEGIGVGAGVGPGAGAGAGAAVPLDAAAGALDGALDGSGADSPWLSLVENIHLEKADWFDSLLSAAHTHATPHADSYSPPNSQSLSQSLSQRSGAGAAPRSSPRDMGGGGGAHTHSALSAMTVSSLITPSPPAQGPAVLFSPAQLAALAPVAGADATHWVDAAWNGTQLLHQ